MSFWSKLKLTNYGRFRPPAGAPLQASPFSFWFQQFDVPDDLQLSIEQKLACPPVYAGIKCLADDIGRAKVRVFNVDPRGRRTPSVNDRLDFLLNLRPNAAVTALSFRQALVVQAKCHGNSYAEIVWDDAGRVKELQVIPSTWVTPLHAFGGEELQTRPPRVAEPREWIYRINVSADVQPLYMAAADVIHLRDMATVDGTVGDSVLSRASKAISLYYALEKFGLAFFVNYGAVGGFLKVDPKTTATQIDKAMADWKTKRGGPTNAFNLYVSTGDYTPGMVDLDKTQMIQLRQFLIMEIARHLRIPPHKLQDFPQNAPARNDELSDIAYVRDALEPLATALEQELNAKLCADPRRPFQQAKVVELDFGMLMRGNSLQQAQADELRLQTGTRTIDELREDDGLDHLDVDGSDETFIQSGLVPLERAVEEPEPTPAHGVTPGDAGAGADGRAPSTEDEP